MFIGMARGRFLPGGIIGFCCFEAQSPSIDIGMQLLLDSAFKSDNLFPAPSFNHSQPSDEPLRIAAP